MTLALVLPPNSTPGAAPLCKRHFGSSRELLGPSSGAESVFSVQSMDREGAGVTEETHTSPRQVPLFGQKSSFRPDFAFCQTVSLAKTASPWGTYGHPWVSNPALSEWPGYRLPEETG